MLAQPFGVGRAVGPSPPPPLQAPGPEARGGGGYALMDTRVTAEPGCLLWFPPGKEGSDRLTFSLCPCCLAPKSHNINLS